VNTLSDGSRAVAGSQMNYMLKDANTPVDSYGSFGGGGRGGSVDAASRSLGLSGKALPATAAPEAKLRNQMVEYSQQTRFVNGRNFFQNDKQWLDAEVQKHQDAKRVRLQFGSSEYFAFAAKNRQALPWLALGQNVQFVLDGTVYEVYE
jgi:hypothetical protein